MKRRSLLAGVLVVSSPAAAAAAERVALLLPGCELPGVSATALREAVALDLQPDGLVLAPAGELSPGRDVQVLVEATCSSPEELTLSAEHGAARQRRFLRLSDLSSEQRPRALSLALTELVSLVVRPPASPSAPEPEPGIDLEPGTKPEPEAAPALDEAAPTPAQELAPPSPVTPVAPTDEARATPPPVAPWRLGLAPQLRFFEGTVLWGALAQLSRARWRFGAGLLAARDEAPAGSVWTSLANAGAGYAFPLWGDAAGAALESGPRLGLGYAFMSARAADGAVAYDARDWYLDVAWTARYQTAISSLARLGLGAELGYGRGPIGYADDVVIAKVSGGFAAVTVDGSLPL